jgi:hypothetical protein
MATEDDDDRPREEAERLLREGWVPFPFRVGALCRKGTNWPSVHVAPHLWQAMRELLEQKRRDGAAEH